MDLGVEEFANFHGRRQLIADHRLRGVSSI